MKPVALSAGAFLLAWVAMAYALPRGDAVARPVWTAVLSALSPALAAPQLRLDAGAVSLAAGLGQPVLVGHQLLEPDPRHRVSARVPLGPALLLPALLLAAALACACASGRAPRALAGLVAAALALALETPLLLDAALHDELLRALSPDSTHLQVAAAQWWNHGGRLVVAAAAVLALLWPLLRPRTAVALRSSPAAAR